jgi:hypothetical protein
VHYIFFQPPPHLQILFMYATSLIDRIGFGFASHSYCHFSLSSILFFVSLVWVLKILAKTIVANYLFFEKRDDVREWNMRGVNSPLFSMSYFFVFALLFVCLVFLPVDLFIVLILFYYLLFILLYSLS